MGYTEDKSRIIAELQEKATAVKRMQSKLQAKADAKSNTLAARTAVNDQDEADSDTAFTNSSLAKNAYESAENAKRLAAALVTNAKEMHDTATTLVREAYETALLTVAAAEAATAIADYVNIQKSKDPNISGDLVTYAKAAVTDAGKAVTDTITAITDTINAVTGIYHALQAVQTLENETKDLDSLSPGDEKTNGLKDLVDLRDKLEKVYEKAAHKAKISADAKNATNKDYLDASKDLAEASAELAAINASLAQGTKTLALQV